MRKRKKDAYKKRIKKVWTKTNSREFAIWFIRTFVQYIEYNVPSYRGKSKKQNKIEYFIIIKRIKYMISLSI